MLEARHLWEDLACHVRILLNPSLVSEAFGDSFDQEKFAEKKGASSAPKLFLANQVLSHPDICTYNKEEVERRSGEGLAGVKIVNNMPPPGGPSPSCTSELSGTGDVCQLCGERILIMPPSPGEKRHDNLSPVFLTVVHWTLRPYSHRHSFLFFNPA